jgi:homoserine dehydrogenase
VRDEPGVLAAIASIFGDKGVSIASVIQKRAEDGGAEIVWITHEAAERDMRTALAAIEVLDVVDSVGSVLRVEEL